MGPITPFPAIVLLLAFISSQNRIVSSSVCTFAPPQNETRALLDFYGSTNGAMWSQPWFVSDGSNPCSPWYGVSCTTKNNVTCHVSGLLLSANTLQGSIPKTFGNLAHLTYLDLSNNAITGTIPSQMGNLVDLQHLYLESNLLVGTIPPSLSNLSQLESVALSSNQLYGPVSDAVGGWTSVSQVDLTNNYFSGPLTQSLCKLGMSCLCVFFPTTFLAQYHRVSVNCSPSAILRPLTMT